MNILEALKSKVSYPVKDNTLSGILIERGLSDSTEFDQTIATGKAFELAKADLYIYLVSGTNISESGYSVSLTDKSNLMKLASAIYSKYGEPNPSAITLTDASSRW